MQQKLGVWPAFAANARTYTSQPTILGASLRVSGVKIPQSRERTTVCSESLLNERTIRYMGQGMGATMDALGLARISGIEKGRNEPDGCSKDYLPDLISVELPSSTFLGWEVKDHWKTRLDNSFPSDFKAIYSEVTSSSTLETFMLTFCYRPTTWIIAFAVTEY